MPIISEYVEVRPTPQTVRHYEGLGYTIPIKEATELTKKVEHKEYVHDFSKTILVKPEHLTSGSMVNVVVLCDMCKENTMLVSYANYNSVMKRTGSYVCRDCAYKKVKQTVKVRYNVDGVSQLEDVKEKRKETMLERYNVEHALQNDVLKNRAMETTKRRYGVEHALQSPEVMRKVNETLCKNGGRKASLQQLYLNSLYGGKLNFTVRYYAVDICFPEEKIALEYDGGGHNLRVLLGALTQEEFDHKEIVRNSVIKREGYKMIRIKSSRDLLPSDFVLLQMLSDARNYFLKTNHTWCSYDIDNNLLFNVEYPDGLLYNYGKLRKIKHSDLSKYIIN